MSNRKPFIVSEDDLVEDRKVTVLKTEETSNWLRLMFGDNRLAFRAPQAWNDEILEVMLEIVEMGELLQDGIEEDAELGDLESIKLMRENMKAIPKMKEFLGVISPATQAEWLANEDLTIPEVTELYQAIHSFEAVQDEVDSAKKKSTK